jgi:hypothetical protein
VPANQYGAITEAPHRNEVEEAALLANWLISIGDTSVIGQHHHDRYTISSDMGCSA